jgi:hypothetical protein
MTVGAKRPVQLLMLFVAAGVLVGVAWAALIGGGLAAAVGASEGRGQSVAPAEARGRALAQLAIQDPALVGVVMGEAARSDQVREVRDPTGLIIQEFDEAKDAFVISFEADGTGEFSNVRGVVVVDAETGEILTSAILKNNEP